MRDKEELKAIALQWAVDTIESWQYEYSAWDVLLEDEELTDEELEFCQNMNFKISMD